MEASQPGRILLIDDDPALGGYLTRVLTRGGFEVTHELDSASALRRIEAQDWDLLITDVVTPEMLGNEVAARVGEIRPGVPALFMSGYAQPILDTHGIPAPCYHILEKPFTEAALLTRVRTALTAPRPPRPAAYFMIAGSSGRFMVVNCPRS